VRTTSHSPQSESGRTLEKESSARLSLDTSAKYALAFEVATQIRFT